MPPRSKRWKQPPRREWSFLDVGFLQASRFRGLRMCMVERQLRCAASTQQAVKCALNWLQRALPRDSRTELPTLANSGALVPVSAAVAGPAARANPLHVRRVVQRLASRVTRPAGAIRVPRITHRAPTLRSCHCRKHDCWQRASQGDLPPSRERGERLPRHHFSSTRPRPVRPDTRAAMELRSVDLHEGERHSRLFEFGPVSPPRETNAAAERAPERAERVFTGARAFI